MNISTVDQSLAKIENLPYYQDLTTKLSHVCYHTLTQTLPGYQATRPSHECYQALTAICTRLPGPRMCATRPSHALTLMLPGRYTHATRPHTQTLTRTLPDPHMHSTRPSHALYQALTRMLQGPTLRPSHALYQASYLLVLLHVGGV